MESKTACLFCGSTDTRESFYPEVRFNNRVFVYQQCRNCKLNFNNPLLDPNDYNALYPLEYHDEFYFKIKKTYSKQLSIVKKYESPAYKKKKFQYEISRGIDLQSEHERYLVEKHFKKPVIVTGYPAAIKAFYMRRNDDGKTVAAMDILAPGLSIAAHW